MPLLIRTFNKCKMDIKKTWSVINDTINTKSNTDNHFDFVIDNKIITDPEENEYNLIITS